MRIASLVGGRLVEKLTPTDVDAQNNTLSAAQIAGGLVVHTSVSAGGTVTTATAAQIIAGVGGVGKLKHNGASIAVYYINDGDQTLTFQGGDNVTIADTGQTIATNESALIIFRRVTATTVVCYILGA